MTALTFNSVSTGCRVLADMANDFWQNRHRILGKEMPVAYLCYELTAKTTDGQPLGVMFVHLAFEQDRWHYTLSDSANIDHDELRFRDDSNNPNWEIRAHSWRHYAFSDLLSPYSAEFMENIVGKDQDDLVLEIANAFPLRPYTGTKIAEFY